MMGAVLKSYYPELNNIDPKKIFVVSVMPCTSKKTESAREEMEVDGLRDVDAVITTRELGKMIKQARIKFLQLPDENFDQVFGEYTGAGVIFGATGGVMEAALRTVADVLTGEDLEDIEYGAVRGVEEGVKEAELEIAGNKIRIAVAHGTANAAKVLEMVKAGEKDYHFIEVMGCSGGCVTGGGQPHVDAKTLMDVDVRVERAKALYEEDVIMEQRKSHKNPMITKIYEEFLGKPNGHKSHDLLHTHYHKREIYATKENCCDCSVEEAAACGCEE